MNVNENWGINSIVRKFSAHDSFMVSDNVENISLYPYNFFSAIVESISLFFSKNLKLLLWLERVYILCNSLRW